MQGEVLKPEPLIFALVVSSAHALLMIFEYTLLLRSTVLRSSVCCVVCGVLRGRRFTDGRMGHGRRNERETLSDAYSTVLYVLYST